MEQFGIGYSPVGDILTMVVTVVNIFLLGSSYSVKKKTLSLFKVGNVCLILAAVSSLIYHQLIAVGLTRRSVHWMIFGRLISYWSLLVLFVFFFLYLSDLLQISKLHHKIGSMTVMGISLIVMIYEVLEQFIRVGFYIETPGYILHYNPDEEIFQYAYVLCLLLIVILMIHYRKRFITRMFRCLVAVVGVAFLVILVQYFHKDSSYSIFTFTLPLTTVLFLFHYNAYDHATGTLDAEAFGGYISDLNDKQFTIIYLYLKDLTMSRMREMSEIYYHFNEKYFRRPMTFRMNQDRLLAVLRDDDNPDLGTKLAQLYADFEMMYATYKIDYKMVVVHSVPDLQGGEDYANLLSYMERRMDFNTVLRIKEDDIGAFKRSMYILSEIIDINKKKDLDDERILVYCQPVLHRESGKFTTAESLMRMKLPELGIVYPDQFIGLAEQFDIIHSLSLTILNKTCRAVRHLIEEGQEFERISVNFSIDEFKDPNFAEDVLSIIEKNQIPFSSIAIEVTESTEYYNHEVVKNTMLKLQKYGIRFYLDDFGTGYSNFERIFDLPVDIIKFDRSLTIKTGESETSRFMVSNFANIFKRSNYQILYEGVESEIDERRCMEMEADYLQGYRYSRPIPVEELAKFIEKNNQK